MADGSSSTYLGSTSKYMDPNDSVTLDLYDPEDVQKYIDKKKSVLKSTQKAKEIEVKKKRATKKKEEAIKMSVVSPVTTKSYERESICHVDSRYRDTRLFPLANSFRIFLGKIYRNVTQVRLVSSEIPNSDDVIKDTNHTISWINLEDADLDYPVYSIDLRNGYYTTSTLQAELESKMRTPKLRNGTSTVNHYFIVSIDTTSDIVTFVNLKLTALDNAPLSTSRGTNLITVTHANHGFLTGQEIYLVGATSVAGITSGSLNNQKFPIIVNGVNTYFIETTLVASDSLQGGGNNVKVGVENPFQFQFGTYSNSPVEKLGFLNENSSVYVNSTAQPLRSRVLSIDAIITGSPTTIFSTDHGLKAGDVVYLNDLVTFPSLLNLTVPRQVTVVFVIDDDSFVINFDITQVDFTTLPTATISTNIFQLEFEAPHGFNRIVEVNNSSPDELTVTMLFDHDYSIGEMVYLRNTDSTPVVDGLYAVLDVPMSDSFTVAFVGGVTTPGTEGSVGGTPFFYLYNVENFDGYQNDTVKWKRLAIRDYIDERTISFQIDDTYMTRSGSFGDTEVKISSNVHGFNGRQTNEVDGSAINLVGENYCYLVSPQLGNAQTNGVVRGDVLAKIKLNANPGEVVFDSFVSAPTYFDPPLSELSEVQLQVKTYDGGFFDFNRLDYSISLAITERIDQVQSTSSQFKSSSK